MSLKNRLNTLRREAGAAAREALPAEGDDLRSRLQRLGGRAAEPRPPNRPETETPGQLAIRLGGQLLADNLILVEQRLALDTPHGRRLLGDGMGPAEPLLTMPDRVAYVDTETTGLAGGTGTVAFMVGIAQPEPDCVRVRQWLITAFSGEAAMLAEVRQALADSELIVSYNGKSFDLPLLRDRQRLHRAELPEPHHFDLLHSVRRLFARSWPDCRLGTVERMLLGLQRLDDLPGSEAPMAWKEFLLGYPEHRLGKVLEHNRLDLLSMLVLPPVLARVMHAPAEHGADPACVAAAWSRTGDADAALEILLHYRNRLDHRGLLMLAASLKRAGRLPDAVAVWERLAKERDCTKSVECLAKYHEHVRRDWAEALAYAERLPDSTEARHRRRRLTRRLAEVDLAAAASGTPDPAGIERSEGS